MLGLLYESLVSLFASLCFGVLFRLRGAKLVFAAGGGMLSWFIYAGSGMLFPTHSVLGFFFAAVGFTFYSECCARILGAPTSIFLTISLIPLVPGNGIYQTMYYCVLGDTTKALAECINTVAIAGALALGIVVVSSVFHALLIIKPKHSFFLR